VGKIAKKGTVFFDKFVIGEYKNKQAEFYVDATFQLTNALPFQHQSQKKVFLYACLRYQL
jgi:hypothetical protein